jgi:DNA-binding NarL/FixJ family response regulator
VRAEVVRLVHRGTGLTELTHGVAGALRRAVPFEGTCLLTVDPATLLPTGEVVENGLPPAALSRLTEIELGEPDFNKFTALARAAVPAASLSEATEGVLDRSVRQREVRRPNGFADELRAVLSGPDGTWGTLTLLRESGRPAFTPTDVRFVASLVAPLADAVRRATLVDETAADVDACGTGFLVVSADDTIELVNDAAGQWIDELAIADHSAGPLPVAVRAVVTQTRHVVNGGSTVASARVRTRTGRWVMGDGSLVGDGQVAVLVEAARPAELASAIADAYRFTDRERAVTGQVARGFSTNEIADRLHLSAYTVQDHLKAIFDKSGTSSRGALVARLFFDHHLPLLAPAPPIIEGANDTLVDDTGERR